MMLFGVYRNDWIVGIFCIHFMGIALLSFAIWEFALPVVILCWALSGLAFDLLSKEDEPGIELGWIRFKQDYWLLDEPIVYHKFPNQEQEEGFIFQ